MDRTQIPLSAEQHQRLGEEAQRRGVSFASLLHSLIDDPLDQQEQSPAVDPLTALIGIGEGTGKAIGRHHNRHLYER